MHPHDTPKPYRLAGEETPRWLALGLMLLGVLGSVATTWLLMVTERPVSAQVPWTVEMGEEDAAGLAPPSSTPIATQPVHPPDDATKANADEAQPPTIEVAGEDEAEPPISTPTAIQPVHPPEDETEANADEAQPPTVEGAGEDEASPPAPTSVTAKPVYPSEDATEATSAGVQPPTVELRDCPPLFTVTFKRGGSRPMAPDLEANVARLQAWLSAHPEAKLRVEGHTDAIGAERSNLLLSYRRATIVAALLAKAGVASEQLVTRAFGEYEPLPGLPAESEKNRRVSLGVEGVQECSETLTEDNRQ